MKLIIIYNHLKHIFLHHLKSIQTNNKNSGQSTIEFLLSFAIVFSFIFFFFKIALNYTSGYLLHYANFMASRTYLVFDANNNDVAGGDRPAFGAAKAVFDTFNVDRAFLSKANAVVTPNEPKGVSLYVGTTVIKSDSFNFASFVGNIGDVEFHSDSFLGREPTRSECHVQICQAMKEIGGECDIHTTFFDNGC